MSLFDDYAYYYDLLYKDKNYKEEADYVHSLIREHLDDARTLLDLGSGTGLHALRFAELGYLVTGLDRSQAMINCAQQNLHRFPDLLYPPEFMVGDVCSLKISKNFDVVTSLFHVLSYQLTNEDLHNMFLSVARHLRTGGIYVFDCWYGPGVMADPPTVRIKRVENQHHKIVRISEPIIHINRHHVDVCFQMFVYHKERDVWREISEKHSMRYFFKEEIADILETAGFDMLFAYEWLTRKDLHDNSWSAIFGVRKL